MYLYDGTSDVDFFYAGTMTHAEISEDPSLADLISTPCVLYDDGEGRVYRFDRLDVLADRYGVEMTDDADQTFSAVVEAMGEPEPDEATDPAVASFVTLALPMVAPTVKNSAIAPVLKFAPEYVETGHAYKKGEVFKYTDGTFWRVSQDITTQSQWVPGAAGLDALFYQIVLAPDGYIVWAQPRGEFDAPDTGDLRHYPDADGPLYRSKVDGNAWAPAEGGNEWWEAFEGASDVFEDGQPDGGEA